MSAFLSIGQKRRLVSLCFIENSLAPALLPRFVARYYEWITSTGAASRVGSVPMAQFLNLSPEEAAEATLRRVTLMLAEHHPCAVPARKLAISLGLDVADGTEASTHYLEDLGTKLLELLIESSCLVEVDTAVDGNHSVTLHPEWRARFRSVWSQKPSLKNTHTNFGEVIQ